MCVDMRWVRNPNCKHSVFVPCGHCAACQQEKAKNRLKRIQGNYKEGMIPLFLTLTYHPDFVPYVRRDELCNGLVNVYRNASSRRVRVSSDYKMSYKKYVSRRVIDILDLSDFDYSQKDYDVLFDLRHAQRGDIGICYYKDIQNFYKNLSQKLFRRFGISRNFSFFSCSEYGPTTFRPHFHALVWCPQEQVDIFKVCINEAWPFDCGMSRDKKCEIAKNAARYVSSYVNRGSSFPSFLGNRKIAPKHSYSQGFGVNLRDFTLQEIIKKVDKGELTYESLVSINGVPDFVTLPVPKYVINRYFPKCMGYGRLPLREVCSVLERPSRLRVLKDRIGASDEVLDMWITRLSNSLKRFVELTGLSKYDYSYYYTRAWKLHDMYVLKDWYDNRKMLPLLEQYDNLSSLRRVFHPLRGFVSIEDMNRNPNSFAFRVNETNALIDEFAQTFKKRKVVNFVMAESGQYV